MARALTLTSAPAPWSGDWVPGLLIVFPFSSLPSPTREVSVTRSCDLGSQLLCPQVPWRYLSPPLPLPQPPTIYPLSSMGGGSPMSPLPASGQSVVGDSSEQQKHAVCSEPGSLKPHTLLPYSSTFVSMTLCLTSPHCEAALWTDHSGRPHMLGFSA